MEAQALLKAFVITRRRRGPEPASGLASAPSAWTRIGMVSAPPVQQARPPWWGVVFDRAITGRWPLPDSDCATRTRQVNLNWWSSSS